MSAGVQQDKLKIPEPNTETLVHQVCSSHSHTHTHTHTNTIIMHCMYTHTHTHTHTHTQKNRTLASHYNGNFDQNRAGLKFLHMSLRPVKPF